MDMEAEHFGSPRRHSLMIHPNPAAAAGAGTLEPSGATVLRGPNDVFKGAAYLELWAKKNDYGLPRIWLQLGSSKVVMMMTEH